MAFRLVTYRGEDYKFLQTAVIFYQAKIGKHDVNLLHDINIAIGRGFKSLVMLDVEDPDGILTIFFIASEGFDCSIELFQHRRIRRTLSILTDPQTREPHRSIRDAAALRVIQRAPVEGWLGKAEENDFHGLSFALCLFNGEEHCPLLEAFWKRLEPLLGAERILPLLIRSYKNVMARRTPRTFLKETIANNRYNLIDARKRLAHAEIIELRVEKHFLSQFEWPPALTAIVLSYAGALTQEQKDAFSEMIGQIEAEIAAYMKTQDGCTIA